MIGDAVLEHVAPGIGKRPERRRHMGAYGLAFRPRRPLARATLEFGDHGRVFDRAWIDVTNARFRHRRILPEILLWRADRCEGTRGPHGAAPGRDHQTPG